MRMWAFIQSNSLILLLVLGTAFTCAWLLRFRRELKLAWYLVPLLSVLHTLVGVLCVKVFAVLETMDFSNLESMSLFGAVFFLPLVYWLGAKLFKRKTGLVFDVLTPCMVFTLLCARVNCLFSGCCLGRQIPGLAARFPTREAELVFYVALMIYLIWRSRDRKQDGLLYPMYLIAYGAFRFLVEGFRSSESGGYLHISHLWAALACCIGLSFYCELKRQGKRAKKKT